jgi:hypothetical protein
VAMLLVHHIHLQQQLYLVSFSFEWFLLFYFAKNELIDFTETLGQELILSKVTGVRATTVLPFYLDGGIYTTLRK